MYVLNVVRATFLNAVLDNSTIHCDIRELG